MKLSKKIQITLKALDQRQDALVEMNLFDSRHKSDMNLFDSRHKSDKPPAEFIRNEKLILRLNGRR